MSTLNNLRELLKTAQAEKRAAAGKSAFSGADSTHPSDKEDDGTMPVKEGPRGAEHEKDLKKVPGPNNVINAPEAKPDEQNSVQMNVGLTSKTVGSDPENEKPDRMKPEDTQKTTHPADAEKMAAADLHRLFESSANGMLAKIAAAAKPAAGVTPEHKAAAAGYADASAAIDAGGSPDPELTKFATALVADYVLAGRLTAQHLKKAAEDDDDAPPADDKPAPSEGGGGGEGGPPPEMSSAPADLVSQMQGGGEGGMPAGPGGPGGGGDQADAQELLSLLAEMGMSPGQLVELLKGGGGGAPGGPGGMAGAAPPPDMGGGGMPPAPADAMGMGGPAGGTDMDPAKMAAFNGLLRLAEYTQKAAAAGMLNVVPATTPAKAASRADVKRAIVDMINPRRRR